MHLDKKLITIIVSSALVGGIIGGGIGSSLGSFEEHDGEGRGHKNVRMEQPDNNKDDQADGETDDDGDAPQSATSTPATASTTVR